MKEKGRDGEDTEKRPERRGIARSNTRDRTLRGKKEKR